MRISNGRNDMRSLRKTIIIIIIFFAIMTSIMLLLRIMRIDNLALGLFLIVVTILGLLIGAAKIFSPEGSKDEQESLKRKRATMTEEAKRREFFEIYGDVVFPWKTEVAIFLILFILSFIITVFFGRGE